MDIAPNYAGTMMGITNMVGNIAGFVTPYVTGAIINENQPGDNPSIFQSFIFPFQLQNWWRISVEIIIIHCLTVCRAGAYNE